MQASDWKPMSEMPAKLRDGRDVLFWYPNCERAFVLACDCDGKWEGDDRTRFRDAELSHFCEIVGPGKDGDR
jgi:hypothetical protein